MTRQARTIARSYGPGVGETRSPQHISSIAHLFFSEEATGSQTHPLNGDRRHFLLVGSGRSTLAPNLAAGLAGQFLAQSGRLEEGSHSGKDVSLRQVFLGEPSAVRYSAFSHLQEDHYRPPRAEETVPWRGLGTDRTVSRVFDRTVPSEDFSAGWDHGRFFLRHMDLPGDQELSGLEALAHTGQGSYLKEDARHGLVLCLAEDETFNLKLATRLGRLLRLVEPPILHMVAACQEDHPADRDGGAAPSRAVRWVAGSLPVMWHALGPGRDQRQDLHASLARSLAG